MQTQHGIAIVGILHTDVKNGVAVLDIDGRQKDCSTACLTGSLHDGITIRSKVNQLLNKNRIYVPEEDFDFVYDFLCQHCPRAKS